MIKPNMLVGEVFADGDFYYEVVKVCEDGTYISKRVAKPTKVEAPILVETKEEEKPVVVTVAKPKPTTKATNKTSAKKSTKKK